MDFLNFSSVETIPGIKARAAFQLKTTAVFKEDGDITPVVINDNLAYMPWGGDNQMPYNIINLIESDETLATCQLFNAEVCYGSGLVYDTSSLEFTVDGLSQPGNKLSTINCKQEVDEFLLDNDLSSYWLGVCQDFKHFGFAVSVIILNAEGNKIVRLLRKEACYCRFAVADKAGRIPKILYANWRSLISQPDNIEVIELLDPASPWRDLCARLGRAPKWEPEIGNRESGFKSPVSNSTKLRKFAILTRVPTPDSTYYPIPHYAALFKGKWYNIKQLIGIAKEAKLKNSAPIKYQIGSIYNIVCS